MNMQRVDRIAFRFTCNELGALLKLMGLPALPDTSVQPEDPENSTVDSLIGGGIVVACGDRTLVDGTISLVLKNAAESLRRITVCGPARQMVLYRGERMCVLAEENGGLVSLEPLRDVPAAWECCRAAAERMGERYTVRLTEGGVLAGEGSGPQALKELFGRLGE